MTAPTPPTPDRTAAVPPHAIVVGVDGSSSSEEALRWALRQASLTGAEVHAVSAWGYPLDYGVAWGEFDWETNSTDVLDKSLQQVVGPDDPPVHRHVVAGHPVRVLLDAARDADLVVVGCRGHGGFAGMLLGSVSQNVAAHAPCPVLVVHDHDGGDPDHARAGQPAAGREVPDGAPGRP